MGANVKVTIIGLQLQGPFHPGLAVVANRKHMRWYLANFLVLMQLNLLVFVDWKNLVWVNYYKDHPIVCLRINIIGI